ncbi:MAG: hypothetical protein AAF653_02635, partial [Chloroflexota bacterium]
AHPIEERVFLMVNTGKPDIENNQMVSESRLYGLAWNGDSFDESKLIMSLPNATLFGSALHIDATRNKLLLDFQLDSGTLNMPDFSSEVIEIDLETNETRTFSDARSYNERFVRIDTADDSRLFDLQSGTESSMNSIFFDAFSSSGGIAVGQFGASCDDLAIVCEGVIQVFDIATRQSIAQLPHETYPVPIKFSPSTGMIATLSRAGRSQEIRIWGVPQ